ncbi:hypothetical protein [Streptomyces sp. NPDC057616]|uniref:hypothetical protein n=1 Tax=Streptomyces sp. NPDC057616 TaxID=3346183 RepID=UPI0036962547
MARERISLVELLRRHPVDLSALQPAPAEPTGRELSARVRAIHHKPCSVCGQMCATSRVHTTPEQGPRWVDLCWDHGLATMPVSRMPDTVEGILAELREAAAEVAAELGRPVPMTVWTDKDGWRDEPRS